jgi:SpoVK/Ycf46/Vps4 family AAA+-type ATPase
VSRPDAVTEVIVLKEPEEIEFDRVAQHSVISRAKIFLNVISNLGTLRDKLKNKGLAFGGRVLLLGSPGTDFGAFAYHVALEMPLKLIRFRTSHAIGTTEEMSSAIRTLAEYAKRNAPALVYIEKLDTFAEMGTRQSAVLLSTLKEVTWDRNEILVVAATTHPERIEEEVLTIFDRVYAFKPPLIDERTNLFETLLGERRDIDTSILGEMTEGWGFSDMVHLSVSLLADVPEETSPISRAKLEQHLESCGAIPISRKETRDNMASIAQGSYSAPIQTVENAYPDEFLDQLYLMVVGDDFQEAQRIIESLNNNLPLTPPDSEFLSRYPFLLTGTPEDRLTRLMRAKRTNDRLSRLMGR